MALAQELSERFLTCGLCTEILKEPCTLPCQHSFCGACFTTYVNKIPRKGHSNRVPCPCCRQATDIPDPTRPAEEWAGQIKNNILIQGLADTIIANKGSKEFDCVKTSGNGGSNSSTVTTYKETDNPTVKSNIPTGKINVVINKSITLERISDEIPDTTKADLRSTNEVSVENCEFEGNGVTNVNRPREEDRKSLKSNNQQNIDNCLNNIKDYFCKTSSSLVLNDVIDIKVPTDKLDPVLCDIKILDINDVKTIVCTDRANKCVKSFHHKRREICHSTLKLENRPWGLAQPTKEKVMVTIPGACQIVAVQVSDVLTLSATITTSKGYYGIVALSPSLLAAGNCGNHGCVDILSTTGAIIKSVTVHNDVRLFASPWYMCVTRKGHILVSDNDTKLVTCLSSDGEVIWHSSTRAASVMQPRGVAAVDTSILLVDRASSKIVQLSESGRYISDIKVFKYATRFPNAVMFDECGLLYICDESQIICFTQSEDGNNILNS